MNQHIGGKRPLLDPRAQRQHELRGVLLTRSPVPRPPPHAHAPDIVMSDAFILMGLLGWAGCTVAAAASRKPEALAAMGVAWCFYLLGAGGCSWLAASFLPGSGPQLSAVMEAGPTGPPCTGSFHMDLLEAQRQPPHLFIVL